MFSPDNEYQTVTDCARKSRAITGLLGMLLAICSLFVGISGWSLYAGQTAQREVVEVRTGQARDIAYLRDGVNELKGEILLLRAAVERIGRTGSAPNGGR